MLDKRNFYINGKWVSPSKSNDFEVINPSNEEPFAIISLGDEADTNSAVKAAKEAFTSWSKTSKEERISLIQKNVLKIYKKRWDEMTKVISQWKWELHLIMHLQLKLHLEQSHIEDFILRLKDFKFGSTF